MPTDARALMGLVDLAVFVTAALLLLYALRYAGISRFAGRTQGRTLVMAGVATFFGIHAIDIVFALMVSAPLDLLAPHTGAQQIPEWLHWSATRASYFLVMAGCILAIHERRRAEQVVSTIETRAEQAELSVEESEQRFRTLFESTSNLIYCYAFDPPMPIDLPIEEQIARSHDAVLTECNEAFAKELDGATVEEVVGTRMGMLDGNQDEEAHRRFISSFVENDYRLSRYKLVYKTCAGDDRAIESSLTGIVEDGHLLRLWGVENNLLPIYQTQAALDRRNRFQRLVARVSSQLVTATLDQADEVVSRSLRNICRYIGADRGSLFWLDGDREFIHAAYEWSETAAPRDKQIPVTAFPSLTEKLEQYEIISIDDLDQLPEPLAREIGAIRSEEGIRAMLLMPLVIGEEGVGIASFVHLEEPRHWSDEDISDVKVLAEVLANYVYRLKSHRALDTALSGLQRATDRLQAENVYLRREIELTHGFDEIIGRSESLLHCLHLVEQVADTATPVLVLGETGTGKELVARAIHEHSSRSERPLVKVNCAALPANLIESELFGYEKGAFTGADRAKRGRFDLAHGSTLFLDEIADIPVELQAKLLRALQEGEIERLGGSKTIKVDVRLIAATNSSLEEAVARGEFRSDLYYRINTFPIELPPLRARGDDIQLLAEHFVKSYSESLGRDVTAISAQMMQQLRDYNWPGNVRELESVIQRALISSTGPVLELAEPLLARYDDDDGLPRVLSSTIADLKLVERDHILSVLDDTGWKIAGKSGAAARLGIPPSTLRSKMKKLEIIRPDPA